MTPFGASISCQTDGLTFDSKKTNPNPPPPYVTVGIRCLWCCAWFLRKIKHRNVKKCPYKLFQIDGFMIIADAFPPWHCVSKHLNAPDLHTAKSSAFIEVLTLMIINNQVHLISSTWMLLPLKIPMEAVNGVSMFS